MADNPLPTPLVYASSEQSSPSKIGSWVSADPGKLGDPLKRNAPLDRQLAVWDNMNRSTLVDLDVFEDEILWPQHKGPFPEPTERAKRIATNEIQALFYPDGTTSAKNVSEDAIAQMIVQRVINRVGLPNKHKASLSQSKTSLTDDSQSKVDAAIYPDDKLPMDGRPDWTHMRLFIEFKKGGTCNDPFDDDAADGQAESWAESRKKIRGQLLWYMRDVFLYQHRTGLYSLLINGPEFRAMRWDRSGVLVTRATNYAQDPVSLLRILWAFALLELPEQGSDPTAILLSPDSAEYKRMDIWAKENEALDLPYEHRSDLSQFLPPSTLTDATAENNQSPGPSRPAPSTRSKANQPTKPVFKFIRDKFRKSLVAGWPRYKLRIGPEGREFLVGKPDFPGSSMFGRGTRGYVALDVLTGELVWVKDSWRPFYVGVEPEGEYLRAMTADPENRLIVPTVITHGDVGGQCTFASTFTAPGEDEDDAESESAGIEETGPAHSDSPVDPPQTAGVKRRYEEDAPTEAPDATEGSSITTKPGLRHLIHYRIAVAEVCLKLENFQYGAQLLRLIEHCITTHRDAYEKFGLLHRDISTGNILILPRIVEKNGKKIVLWHGLLTDWELAKYVPKDNSLEHARQPERTGTWQFMSVAHVEHPKRPVVVADDLESFFHVVLYQAIRYLRHSYCDRVTEFIISYFDTFQQNKNGGRMCSEPKVNFVTEGKFRNARETLEFYTANVDDPSPLNDFLQEWVTMFVERYKTLAEPKFSAKRSAKVEDHMLIADDDDGDVILKARNSSITTRSAAPSHLTSATSGASTTRLRTHQATLDLFRKYRPSPDVEWSIHDKVGDQLSHQYDPRLRVIAAKSQIETALIQASIDGSGSSKKPRLDPQASVHSDQAVAGAGPSGSSARASHGALRGRKGTRSPRGKGKARAHKTTSWS
ncbi:hypothetical protein C8Q70DRAFT_932949 [Cubamyces menziesii]|nr:hypothetical protein C8Q70DRAFT_932949 [Cubamyces menziesii]